MSVKYNIKHNSKKFCDPNIDYVYKYRYKIFDNLPDDIIELIFEKYLNYNSNYKMNSEMKKYKNIKLEPDTTHVFPKVIKVQYQELCNEKLYIIHKNVTTTDYILCKENPEFCTNETHNILIQNRLNELKEYTTNKPEQLYSSVIDKTKINVQKMLTDFEKLINDRTILPPYSPCLNIDDSKKDFNLLFRDKISN